MKPPQLALDFDAKRLARRGDPSTSKAAAARVSEFGSTHRSKIWNSLWHGPATVDEICARTGLSVQQVNKRLPELQETYLAAPTGEERLSASGRQERVWGLRCATCRYAITQDVLDNCSSGDACPHRRHLKP